MNEMISQLSNLYTGAIADTLDELGYHNQCLPSDIRPLADSMKVAGPVYTVLGKRRHYDDGVDPRYRQMDMLDAIPSGAVIIVEPGNESSAAHWGELMTNTALQRGAKGIVINGGLRDSLQILDVGFPAFRKYHSPLTAAYRWNIDSFDIPIKVGNVTIEPGDYVLGDIDGVLIIPQAIIQEVVEQTVAVATKEDVVRASLQDGGNIRELFEEYKVF